MNDRSGQRTGAQTKPPRTPGRRKTRTPPTSQTGCSPSTRTTQNRHRDRGAGRRRPRTSRLPRAGRVEVPNQAPRESSAGQSRRLLQARLTAPRTATAGAVSTERRPPQEATAEPPPQAGREPSATARPKQPPAAAPRKPPPHANRTTQNCRPPQTPRTTSNTQTPNQQPNNNNLQYKTTTQNHLPNHPAPTTPTTTNHLPPPADAKIPIVNLRGQGPKPSPNRTAKPTGCGTPQRSFCRSANRAKTTAVMWRRLLCFAVLLTVTVGCGQQEQAGRGPGAPSPQRSSQPARVAYVVDGDTLRVRLRSGRLAYVRLVGMLSRVSRPAPGNHARDQDQQAKTAYVRPARHALHF